MALLRRQWKSRAWIEQCDGSGREMHLLLRSRQFWSKSPCLEKTRQLHDDQRWPGHPSMHGHSTFEQISRPQDQEAHAPKPVNTCMNNMQRQLRVILFFPRSEAPGVLYNLLLMCLCSRSHIVR